MGANANNPVGTAFQGNPLVQGNQGRVIQRLQFSSPQHDGAVLIKQSKLVVGSCTLKKLFGYNSSASPRFIMLFDTPKDSIVLGQLPTLVIPVPANKSNFSFVVDWDFAEGCAIGSSSTESTFTETAVADLFYGTQFEANT